MMYQKRQTAPVNPVQEKWTADEEITLIEFLLKKHPGQSRSKAKGFIEDKRINVNGNIATLYNHLIKPGDRISVLRVGLAKPKPPRGIKILFEDDDIIVIDKPAGLLSIGTDREKEKTAYSMMTEYVRVTEFNARIFIVHRLDRDTSGVMVFARSEKIKNELQNAWSDANHRRIYTVIIEGTLFKKEGTINASIREAKSLKMHLAKPDEEGQDAITKFKIIDENKRFSLVEAMLLTGRKNQIRVHFESLGHPVAGDKKYGATTNPLGRLCLHATVLSFRHPGTGKKMTFTSQVPSGFSRLFR